MTENSASAVPPGERSRIAVACSEAMYRRSMTAPAAARLSALGEVVYEAFEEPSSWEAPPPYSADAESRLSALVRDADALVIGPGAPRVSAAVLDAAPRLRFVGELEGDRFARRIDLAAAAARGVKVVDTTQGSSDPVAEWALALMLIGLRNAGELFRRLIAGEVIDRDWKKGQVGYRTGELAGKTVGIVGCGYIGRRLIELLRPFGTRILVHDPAVPRVLGEVLDVGFVGLDAVFATADVIVVTVPLTAATRGMIGARQFGLMRPETVFVNVGRGAVVVTGALLDRLRQGDIVACLDVLDPEPIPEDSPLRRMHNVFLSPHIAGVTADCGPRFVTLLADDLERFWTGRETRFDLTPRE